MARLSEFHNLHHDVCGRQDGVKDDNVDITTGVTTRFPGGVDGHQAGYNGVRLATQVGPRAVEGVWGATTTAFRGSTRGSRRHRSCYENGDGWQCWIVPPSVCFVVK